MDLPLPTLRDFIEGRMHLLGYDYYSLSHSIQQSSNPMAQVRRLDNFCRTGDADTAYVSKLSALLGLTSSNLRPFIEQFKQAEHQALYRQASQAFRPFLRANTDGSMLPQYRTRMLAIYRNHQSTVTLPEDAMTLSTIDLFPLVKELILKHYIRQHGVIRQDGYITSYTLRWSIESEALFTLYGEFLEQSNLESEETSGGGNN
ncbi:MAG: hypothetical protein OEM52_08160 [bacterium]|nr:hypothetical protein [bacterium]